MSRRRSAEIVLRSRASFWLPGSSSVRRSSNDGCSRSTDVTSDTGSLRALLFVGGGLEFDLTNVQERVFVDIGRQQALSNADEQTVGHLAPFRLARKLESAVVRSRGSDISSRNQG